MKSILRHCRYIAALCMMSLLPSAGINAQNLPLQMKDGAGMLRIGVACDGNSRWLDLCKLKQSGKSYTAKSVLPGVNDVCITILPLTDSDGFILKATKGESTKAVSLCWAFGACSATEGVVKSDALSPDDCRDNVFSVEGNGFSTYYGESMKLKVTNGVAPLGSEVRLSDGHKQESPLELFASGKDTDAPVIAAMAGWENNEALYICIYKQNAKADYNYYMLPALFDRELNKK